MAYVVAAPLHTWTLSDSRGVKVSVSVREEIADADLVHSVLEVLSTPPESHRPQTPASTG